MQRPVFYAIAINHYGLTSRFFTLQRVEGRLFKPMAGPWRSPCWAH